MKIRVKLACKRIFIAVFTSEESPMILVRSQNVQEYTPSEQAPFIVTLFPTYRKARYRNAPFSTSSAVMVSVTSTFRTAAAASPAE